MVVKILLLYDNSKFKRYAIKRYERHQRFQKGSGFFATKNKKGLVKGVFSAYIE